MNYIAECRHICTQDCVKTAPDGTESRVEVAYIRGSQISFLVLPPILQKAPFFNRIKMWRKFKGHAIYGANTALVNGTGRGFGGRGGGGPGGFGGRGPPRGPPSGGGAPSHYGPQGGSGGGHYGPGGGQQQRGGWR